MGTFATTLRNWASLDEARVKFYGEYPDVLLAWLNEAELRFADKSEILEGTWSATVSSGTATLPSDFLREFPNRVKWSSYRYLKQMAYETAVMIDSWADTTHYSIFNGTFYVWAAASATLSIPYIKKPTAIAITAIGSADLAIPTEYHRTLEMYLDSRWARKNKDIVGEAALLRAFDNQARQDGQDFHRRRRPVPVMESSRF